MLLKVPRRPQGFTPATAPNTVAATVAAARWSMNAMGRGVLDVENTTVPGYLDIRNHFVSYRFPILDKPYSRDDQGNLVL